MYRLGQQVMYLVTLEGYSDTPALYVEQTRDGKHKIDIDGIYLYVDLDKLVDAQEYWAKKNAESTEPTYIMGIKRGS